MVKISRETIAEPLNHVEMKGFVKDSSESLGSKQEKQGRERVFLPNSMTTRNPRRLLTINNKGEGRRRESDLNPGNPFVRKIHFSKSSKNINPLYSIKSFLNINF